MVIGITIFVLCSGNLLSQLVEISREDVISEGRLYLDKQDNILYTDAIVVKFIDNITDLSMGVRYANIYNIKPGFPDLIALITNLELEYGQIKIVKQILNTQWGDVTRINKRTGEIVTIKDLSQL